MSLSTIYRDDASYQCIVIFAQHANVLQYKESWPCYPDDGDEDCEAIATEAGARRLCDSIVVDAPLFSMFRIDAEAIDCPFQGSYEFTYRRSAVECAGDAGARSAAVSRAHSCTDRTRMHFFYRSCADRTEAQHVTVRCLAQWHVDSDSSRRYVLADVDRSWTSDVVKPVQRRSTQQAEERFRCYVSVA